MANQDDNELLTSDERKCIDNGRDTDPESEECCDQKESSCDDDKSCDSENRPPSESWSDDEDDDSDDEYWDVYFRLPRESFVLLRELYVPGLELNTWLDKAHAGPLAPRCLFGPRRRRHELVLEVGCCRR